MKNPDLHHLIAQGKPACNCADWGMMGCLSTCATEIYKRNLAKLKADNDVQGNQDHLDSTGTVHCVVTSVDLESGGPFIVTEGPCGTGTDVSSTGTSPADSQQVSGSGDPDFIINSAGPAKGGFVASEPGEIFSDGILIESITFDEPVTVRNGETLSINRGTFEVSVNGKVVGKCHNDIVADGNLPVSGQNIKRAFKSLFTDPWVAADFASIGVGVDPVSGVFGPKRDVPYAGLSQDVFRTPFAGALLSPTAKELGQGVGEDAAADFERRLTEQFSRVFAKALATARTFLNSLGTHRREACLRDVCRGASPEAVALFRKLIEDDPGSGLNLRTVSWPNFSSQKAIKRNAERVADAKAAPVGDDFRPDVEVASKPGE